MPNDSFLRLVEGRRNEILRIAAEEFAQCGYSGASTNTITKRAGISKGILFHWFGSKKELYLYLLSDVVERFAASVERESAGISGAALYDGMAALFRSKAAYFGENPLDIGVLERAHLEQSEEVRPDINHLIASLAAKMQRQRVALALQALGRGRLRPGVTQEQALECVMLSLDALDARFSALYRGRGADVLSKPEPILATMKLYLDVVCRGLFEEEQP